MDIAEIYKNCYIIREFEKTVEHCFDKGLMRGTTHGCIGQEIIPVMALHGIDKEYDYVTGTHRSHGQVIAYTGDVYALACEMLGKKDGFNYGLGGSQHIKTGNYITNGITGGMAAVGVGMAMSIKRNNKQGIVISFLGDGGFNEGYVQEALLISQVFQTPSLFICENNMYAMSTCTRDYPTGQIHERAGSLGMKSMCTGYEDLNLMYRSLQDGYRYVAEHRKPAFIEVKCFRLCGHSKSDNLEYMSKQEKDSNLEADPLMVLRGKLAEETALLIEASAAQVVADAFRRAEACSVFA